MPQTELYVTHVKLTTLIHLMAENQLVQGEKAMKWVCCVQAVCHEMEKICGANKFFSLTGTRTLLWYYMCTFR